MLLTSGMSVATETISWQNDWHIVEYAIIEYSQQYPFHQIPYIPFLYG